MASDRDASRSSSVSLDESIKNRAFAQVRRGFDPTEVRRYLGELADDLARLRARGDELAVQLRDAEHRAAHPVVTEEAVVAAVGDEMASIVRSAHAAASELRARSTDEAARLLEDAAARAASVGTEADERMTRAQADAAERLALASTEADERIARARADAETIVLEAREEATAEAARMVAKARSDADLVRRQAEQERRMTVETAQAVRERILGDLTRRRRVATVQIEQLRAGRERLLESYGVVRRTLEEVHDELQRADAEARAAADEVGRRLGAEAADEAGAGSTDAGVTDIEETDIGVTDMGVADIRLDEPLDEAALHPGATGDDGPASSAPDDVPGTGEDEGRVSRSSSEHLDSGAQDRDGGSDEPGSGSPVGGAPSPQLSRASTDEATVQMPAVVVGSPPEPGSPTGGSGRRDRERVRLLRVGRGGGAVALAEREADELVAAPDVPAAGGEPDAAHPATDERELRAPEVVIPEAGGASGPASEVSAGAPEASTPGDAIVVEVTAAEVTAAEFTQDEPPGDGSGDVVGSLFDRIRAGRQRSVAEARRLLGPGPDGVASAGLGTRADDGRAVGPVSGSSVGPVATHADASGTEASPTDRGGLATGTASGEGVAHSDDDEAELQRRDADLEIVVAGLTRRLKRALHDEHNDLLDRLRSARGVPTPAAVIGDEDRQADRYATAARPFVDEAAVAGARRIPSADGTSVTALVERATGDLAAAIVEPLRLRIATVLAERGADSSDVLVDALASVYREMRSQRVEPLAADALHAAHIEAMWTVAPDGTRLRWIAEDVGGPCPDCDDNVLAGALPKGEAFPTGQLHPPAHRGCHCLLVVEAEGA